MASIALIDNDASYLETMQALLTLEHHKVMTHTVASTAFDLIRNKQPDLVILDMRLDDPESGWMILDRMRLDPRTAPIPVIMCSGDRQMLERNAEYLQEQGCCLLAKPFKIPQLLALMTEALNIGSRACGEPNPPIKATSHEYR